MFSPNSSSARFPAAARFFHAGASALMIALVLWGFHHFYFQGKAYPGRELTPPIRTLVILHGVSMALWMLFALGQPLLIAFGNRRLHMAAGKAGAAAAAVIAILGVKLGVEGTRIAPADAKIWTLTPKQFLAVPFFTMLLFAGFVTAGILNRRRPELHRAAMLLATLAVLGAAVSRIDALNALYTGTILEPIFGPFLGISVLSLLFLAAKRVIHGALDRWYAAGCAALIAAGVFIMQIARTGAWDAFAGFLMG